jgi:hypothetical protein
MIFLNYNNLRLTIPPIYLELFKKKYISHLTLLFRSKGATQRSIMKKILLLSIFLSFSLLFPDTITLKSGKVLSGTFIEQSNRFVIYSDERGIVLNIPKAEIATIQLNDLGRPPTNLPQKTADLTLSGQIQSPPTTPGSSDTNGVEVEVTHEVVSDFIWRGNSYGGEYLARRNNTPYKEISEYYAYQPNLKVISPTGFYFELWGNMSLQNRKDKDSDLRVLQTSPGGLEVDPNYYSNRLANGNFYNAENGSSVLFDPNQNLYSSNCDPSTTPAELCNIDPRKLKNRREQNGMWRTDGLFTTFAYNFDAGKFGNFTAGVWWYFENDRLGRYSWDEYFIWWSLPIFKKALNPQIQLYTQGSQDLGGAADGGNYLSLNTSHTFREDKFFRIQPYNIIGYKNINNNYDKKSGFFDITTGLKFFFGAFFISLNNAHRPDPFMYDNSTFYYPDTTIQNRYYTDPADSTSFLNRSQYDGKTTDPSKLFGYKNELFYSLLDGSEADQLLKNYLGDRYSLQTIPKNLVWVSMGFQHKL